jgi:hypothetical protein
MTFDEIKASTKVTLTTTDVGRAIGISPTKLTDQARTDPSKLGFPVIVADGTVRIPRGAFIRWIEGDLEVKT